MEAGAMTGTGGVQPRSVEAGRGVAWWTEAWALFMKSAALWVVMGLILFVIMFVLAFIPIVGGVVASLIVPVLMGGWMLAARKLEDGGTIEVGDLFTCFKGDKMSPLLVVGALFLAAMVVVVLVATVMGLGAAAGIAVGGARNSMGGMMAGLGVGMLTALVVLALALLAGMALWFAPALVVFRNVAPLEAMKQSFAASMKNVMPFLLYGLIYIVASIVASIPIMLGWLVLAPLVFLTAYTSYKDIYGT